MRAGRPASVRPGATALVLGDGTIEGFVGGHCAEPSVRLHALRVLETGEPLLLRIEPGDGEGAASDGAITVHNPCISGGALEIFLEPHVPKPRLRVIGDTPIAHALAELAPGVGFEVGREPSDGDAALVVASHGRDEEEALATALDVGVPYVGLVASRRRGQAVVAEPRGLRRRPRARPHSGGARHRGAHAGGDRAVDPGGDRGDAARAGVAAGPGPRARGSRGPLLP